MTQPTPLSLFDRALHQFQSILYSDKAKYIALACIFIYGYKNWYSDIFDIAISAYATKNYTSLSIFSAITLISFASIVITAFLRHSPLKYLFLAIFLLSLITESASFSIFGDNISVSIFSDLLLNRAEFKFGFLTYAPTIVACAAIWITLFAPLFPRTKKVLPTYLALIPVIAFASSYWYTLKNANLLEFLPANTSVVARLVVASQQKNPDVERKRDALDPSWVASVSGYKNVVLIVDESVRSDYLQLNGFASDNTPFLSGRSDLINFGTSVSYANCSAGSRMAMRSMTREKDIPDPNFNILKQPTFWQYAKRAGYSTIYIDGWLQVRPRHSFLTLDELSYVDQRLSASLIPFYSSDQRIADKLADLLKGDGKKFIFVEKIGIHTPYDMNLENPSVANRRYIVRPGLTDTQNHTVQNYIDAIYFQVDKFFETLLKRQQYPNTIFLYTSDHGQSMYDGKYEATHCTRKDTVRGEGMVPLFAFASEGPLRDELEAAAKQNFDKTSHYDLPATLLRLMGYSNDLVSKTDGGGVFTVDAARKRRFFSGSPFSPTVTWNYVDP